MYYIIVGVILTFLQVELALSDQIQKNVIDTPLKMCCLQPITGFYRDGYCRTGPNDLGTHVVAATVSQEFLDFTKWI